jgi:hypothetical protein
MANYINSMNFNFATNFVEGFHAAYQILFNSKNNGNFLSNTMISFITDGVDNSGRTE